VCETVPAWTGPINQVRKREDLPCAARAYLDRISAVVKLPVSIVSVGPDHEETIICH
jgi:adenylosuccinate synthase